MEASKEERIQKWAAKRQLASLKKRLSAYEHPLDEHVLKSSKQVLQRAQKRNQDNPWEFILPVEESAVATTSTQSDSPDSGDSNNGKAAAQDDFQSQLRDSSNLKWLNTLDEQPLTLSDQLKGKFLVVDFWTSCCINCIHVLAELEELEAKFKDFPEIAFIGVHSAKFDQEEAVHMLRQAVIRYDVKHACLNDCKFDVWNSFKLNNWPTLLIVGPDQKIISKLTEERNVDAIEHLLYQGLQMHTKNLEKSLAENTFPQVMLSTTHLPIKLEKEKAAEHRARQRELGATDDQFFAKPEAITALRQNLSQPGKLIHIDASKSPTLTGEVTHVPLPYANATELLIIADSSNNRMLVLDACTNTYLEQIGNGKSGYKEGNFAEAEFSLIQGFCHFVNPEGQHCLMVCDVKNHLIREINLNTKQVRHVAGVKGVRGGDTVGGQRPAQEQELASPWDIILCPRSGEFILAMAGTHQIWRLDTRQANKCYRQSGSGAEGNENSMPLSTTWAQPSGVTLGRFNGESTVFVADSESSAVRALSVETGLASNVAGANEDASDLFDFGDSEGVGYAAKLQHPLGVYYCEVNQTLYVADTYNHKIKVMKQQGQDKDSTAELTSEVPLLDWLGNSQDAQVVDGTPDLCRLNEPNGCFARVQTSAAGEAVFKGLYIADTGSDCVRFAHPDGRVETLDLVGVPDVRLTASTCVGGQCTGGFDFGENDVGEEQKKDG